MSPPIRDGSGNSIGSIRLGDGTEISEVRTGAGDVLFSAIPDSVVDNFEDDPDGFYSSTDDISTYYSLVKDQLATRDTTFSIEGSKSFKFDNNSQELGYAYITEKNVQFNTPQINGDFSCQIRAEIPRGAAVIGIIFGLQDKDNFYTAGIRYEGGLLKAVPNISKVSGGTRNKLKEGGDISNSEVENKWLDYNISWTSSNIDLTIKDQSGSQLGAINVSESDYSSGGYGFMVDGSIARDGGAVVNFDDYRQQ